MAPSAKKTMPVSGRLFSSSRATTVSLLRQLSFAVGILESQGQVEQNDKLASNVGKGTWWQIVTVMLVDFLQPFWTFAVLL